MVTENLLTKAEDYARALYAGLKRKSGEDFINHPMRVKSYLEQIGIKDEVVLSAALLHALPHEGKVKMSDIQAVFGEEVAYLVKCLTDVSIVLPMQNKKENIAILHKLIIQLSKDIRALLIRLADRLDNVKTAYALPEPDQIWLAQKASQIYAPIAKACGIYFFARELEDESFKILNPARYKLISEFQKNRFLKVEHEFSAIKEKLEEFLASQGVTNFEIAYRQKGIASTSQKAYYKAKKKDIKNDEDFDSLYDLLGIRVLVPAKADCYLVLAYAQQNWENIQNEFDDYIAHPKDNGYQSLQTAIKLPSGNFCELQIRTFDMHASNEYGASSHFTYKYGTTREKNVSWISELIKLKDNLQSSLSENSAINLFEETIFAFTPKGDLITLPHNASAIDFAYAVHTQIGNSCSGVYINGAMQPLSTKIKSGDRVEVLTQKNKKPSAGWLEMAVSSLARSEIKKSLG